MFSYQRLTQSQNRKQLRIDEIDRAKGLAILLVVIGHLVTGEPPKGNEWFSQIIVVIYSFHMPFFMYLSGFVMFHSFRPPETMRGYIGYVKGKFLRLAPGFFCFAIIILVGKILASRVVHVDNQPLGLIEGLIDIILTPGLSAAKGLWFIYVLFEYYLVVPILLFIFGGRTIALVILGLMVHFLPTTQLFMLDGAFEYLIYFGIGAFIAQHYQKIEHWLDEYRSILLVIFFASFLLLEFSTIPYPVTKLIIGCLSIPALHALVRTSPINNSKSLLAWGLVSYAIYLMNTIAIGLAKGVLLSFMNWDGAGFLFVAPVLLIAGLYGPIVAKRYIFQYIKPLDKITT